MATRARTHKHEQSILTKNKRS